MHHTHPNNDTQRQLDLFNTAFHNTTDEPAEKAKAYQEKATDQNVLIMEFFKRFPDKEISATHIEFNQVLPEDTPKTSIRRALSDLAKPFDSKKPRKWAGKIDKVGKVESPMGRTEFTYKLKTNTQINETN